MSLPYNMAERLSYQFLIKHLGEKVVPIQKRKLGKQGPDLSAIGFGAWSLGGADWFYGKGEQDDATSIQSVQTAMDIGINFFDTAAVYGLGHSERVLGRALMGRRHDAIIATKCGIRWDEQERPWKDGSYDAILEGAETSLRRLQTDYIDLLQMHWPDTDTNTPPEETMRAMERLVKDGKVRYVGVSNYEVPLLQRSLQVRHVDALQPPYSLFDRSVEQELLPFCQENGIGVVAYSPLANGLLSGKYTETTQFSEKDVRSRLETHTGDGLKRNIEKVRQLSEIANSMGCTVPQLAIAYVLAHPAVTSAIVGVRLPIHITSIVSAMDIALDETTIQRMQTIFS